MSHLTFSTLTKFNFYLAHSLSKAFNEPALLKLLIPPSIFHISSTLFMYTYMYTYIHMCMCIYKEFITFLRLDIIRAITEICFLGPIAYTSFVLLTDVTAWNITSQNRAGRFLKQIQHTSQ